GAVVDSLDMYGSLALQQRRTYRLAAGRHRLAVGVSGAKSAASLGRYVFLDAILAEGVTAYEESSPQVAYGGAWTTWSNPGHSGGTARYSNQTGATATLSFEGTFVGLVYARHLEGGIATVSIDGAVVDSLDMYGSLALQQRRTYSVAAGAHQLVISVSGAKSAASLGRYIFLDAILADAALYEESGTQVSYGGAWINWSDPGLTGGTARYSNQTGATATLDFGGTFVRLVYALHPEGGIATVTIDGVVVDNLDMYGSLALQQRRTYSVAAGRHRLVVSVSGTKSAASLGRYIFLDAFLADAAFLEESSPQVAYGGAWTNWTDAGLLGGTARYSNQTGASATFHFSGSSMTLVYARHPEGGIATVSIDGVVVDSLDMYGSLALQRRRTYSLAAGAHQLVVSVSGTKSAASLGRYVFLDAFLAE
ncbi:MAG: hypothetical protein HY330_03245, partial [Chloroflexi bacterium]|nr:hypothetical protein [Chloroflexota bacterium]